MPLSDLAPARPVEEDLPGGVLRVAAALPATGPRAGDLRPVAAWIGERIAAMRVAIEVSDPICPREHLWMAPGAPPRPELATVRRPVYRHGDEVAQLAVTLPAVWLPTAAGPAAAGPTAVAGPAVRSCAVEATDAAGTAGATDASATAAKAFAAAEASVAALAAVLGVVVTTASARAAARAARGHAQETLATIADTRYRAASRMESERHALERDLHDGAQLHLVSLQFAAAVVEHTLASGEADENTLPDALADLESRLDRTHQLLVETAAGITPGPLRDGGLAAALALSFREAHDVTLRIAPAVRARRYPPIVESTVYLTCLEAVSNAQKHAAGAPVTVTVLGTYHGLSFEITDAGPGLDAATTGLAGLRARLAAIGGTLRVTSAPGTGTHVAATVPL